MPILPTFDDLLSPAQKFAQQSEAEQRAFLDSLSPNELEYMQYNWRGFWGRPKQLLPAIDGSWRVAMYLAGRGFGKALATNTQIPTISGYKTMGDIEVGDVVFDDKGDTCNVTYISPIYKKRICYCMVFENQDTHKEIEVIADGHHLWQVLIGHYEYVLNTKKLVDIIARREIGNPYTPLSVIGTQAHPHKINRFEIRKIEVSKTVPVRCIQVDSPSHLFCITESFIPTHNTRLGTEAILELVLEHGYKYGVIIGRTMHEVNSINVEGDAGILKNTPKWVKVEHKPSKKRLEFSNGATIGLYSADSPDSFRGANSDFVWADELASWNYPDAWTQANLGLRYGKNPIAIVTTTPRPTPFVKAIMSHPKTYLVKGTTYENTNLSQATLEYYRDLYEGTTIGQQELLAEILDDEKGALWTRALLNRQRIRTLDHNTLSRIVVGVDPSVKSKSEKGAECGIVVCGMDVNRNGYVLADRSVRGTPNVWAEAVIMAYVEFSASAIIAEDNQGGELIEQVLTSKCNEMQVTVPRIISEPSTISKERRAEPVSGLYEQGKVWHVGDFPILEDQMCTWKSGDRISPDRQDSMVFALRELLMKNKAPAEYHRVRTKWGRPQR